MGKQLRKQNIAALTDGKKGNEMKYDILIGGKEERKRGLNTPLGWRHNVQFFFFFLNNRKTVTLFLSPFHPSFSSNVLFQVTLGTLGGANQGVVWGSTRGQSQNNWFLIVI